MPEPLTPAEYVARGFIPTRIGTRIVYVAPPAYYARERKRAAQKQPRASVDGGYRLPTKAPG